MKRGLPIGTEDFGEIIEQGSFYVDKTAFIEEILKDSAKVKLFTRPRRFGKTLTLSMLRYFFNIENKEENEKFFSELYISNSEYMKYQGKYPVIFITLKDLKHDTWKECLKGIKSVISDLYDGYSFIRESLDDRNKKKFVTAIPKNENETNTITTSDGQEFRVVATKSDAGTCFDGTCFRYIFSILVLFIFKLQQNEEKEESLNE